MAGGWAAIPAAIEAGNFELGKQLQFVTSMFDFVERAVVTIFEANMDDEHVKQCRTGPDGNYELQTQPTDARDLAMGKYIDAFGRLEGMAKQLIAEIAQYDYHQMGSFFALLSTSQVIQLLESTAHSNLLEEGYQRIKHLCEKLRNRNVFRNRIVHGEWTIFVIMKDNGATQQWVRKYHHVNDELRNLPYTDPRVAGIYTFTIPELEFTTQKVEEAVNLASGIFSDLPKLRAS